VVRSLATAAGADAAGKRLDFSLNADVRQMGWVNGDRKRFDQVLSNLLSNAVKFTDAGRVELTVAGGGDEVWRFDVRDTGVGFDPANIAVMFEPFSQADGSMTRRAGGTGLGLSLAREMARAMGGDLSADGAPGKGACFSFTLPLAALETPVRTMAVDAVEPVGQAVDVSAADADADVDAGAEEGAIRVLLADDHANNRAVIELILGSVGVQMVSVENGAEAVEAYKAQPFDVVLMDLQMPVMDGITAIREIRAHEANLNSVRTPIVVVSANVQSEHMRRSAEAGADAHLAKPILAPTLLAAIDEALTVAEEAAATAVA
jgi:CheY-like chemotaxis protein/anti-sigma regulatory factor (Ser/Thr protein kinase)